MDRSEIREYRKTDSVIQSICSETVELVMNTWFVYMYSTHDKGVSITLKKSLLYLRSSDE